MNHNKKTDFRADAANALELIIATDIMDEDIIDVRASAASDRLMSAVSTLSEGQQLSISLIPDAEEVFRCCVHTSGDVEMTQDDADWIFDRFASSAETAAEIKDELQKRAENGVILLGVSCEDSHAKSGGNSSKKAESLRELAEYVMKEQGSICIVSEPGSAETACHGRIQISFPGKVSLKLRAMIACAFPFTTVKSVNEVTASDINNHQIPEESLRDHVSGLLRYVMDSRLEIAKDLLFEDLMIGLEDVFSPDDEISDEESEILYSDPRLIEVLDLCVRSYNCLRRAGITTIGELRKMSDDDLLHIRNLGQKNLAEIRDKLAACPDYEPDRLKPDEQAADRNEKTAVCMAELAELIGLEEVKAQVRKIAAYAKMKQDMSEQGTESIPLVLNMEFTGNPGTAKTTVARILAGIFKEIGLLSGSELIEVGRADLVAKYTGQTADQVKAVFRRAKGKMLFIDEAYSLVDAWENSFGDEAISTIVQEMENNRDDTVVVFAGYPDKMKDFFDRNPGLKSRVPFSIHFKDYSVDELLQITELEAKRRGFAIDEAAKSKIIFICRSIAGVADMGNGRFCRNLVEGAILNYASRVYGGAEKPGAKDYMLISEDFELREPAPEIRRRPIGFTA